jgi:uncharacterized protein (TIGR00369 family)
MGSIPDGFEPLPVMGPFDQSVAPLYWRRKDPQFTLGMLVELRHCNLQDIVHGGAMATLVDVAMGCTARVANGGRIRCVTATMTLDFIGRASVGDWIEARGEVLRLGKRLVYVQCLVWKADECIARASGTFAPVGVWEEIPDAHVFGPRR